ncbi:zinc-finger-containing protein [Spartinivicinus ruber]|uniref:zinc-finger-containing protein n=1 Tax=Spartinivicinus ruber TaxID=2683272 RepID=UPI0013D08007|nr:zinc-finger-containing protein [Spartinivicinus ruber]
MIKCPYCSREARLVTGNVIYPHKPELSSKYFWQCAPCDAYVGCHARNLKYGNDGTVPLGRLANRELRKAKSLAHVYFDKIWQKGHASREMAYHWLAAKMQISREECHIGLFDVEQCFRAIELSREFLEGGRV